MAQYKLRSVNQDGAQDNIWRHVQTTNIGMNENTFKTSFENGSVFESLFFVTMKFILSYYRT